MPEELRHVFRAEIAATPEQVWTALVEAPIVRRYYFGFDFTCDLVVGGEYTLDHPEHGTQIDGEIVEIDPPRRLVQTFRFTNGKDAPTRVTWTIEPLDAGGCALTLVHDGFDGETDTYKGVPHGWPNILAGLKSILETGELPQAPTGGSREG